MFEFSRGAFFGGLLNYSIKNLHFSMKALNAFRHMKCFEFDITEDEMSEIGNIISPVKNRQISMTMIPYLTVMVGT